MKSQVIMCNKKPNTNSNSTVKQDLASALRQNLLRRKKISKRNDSKKVNDNDAKI